ncbi:MAG: hypothetical protein NTZ83_05615 [Candidatus Pacearchaeota archaeon]|nr:hypothetical protein [Candidatus Pacearchaeota archaeon]
MPKSEYYITIKESNFFISLGISLIILIIGGIYMNYLWGLFFSGFGFGIFSLLISSFGYGNYTSLRKFNYFLGLIAGFIFLIIGIIYLFSSPPVAFFLLGMGSGVCLLLLEQKINSIRK